MSKTLGEHLDELDREGRTIVAPFPWERGRFRPWTEFGAIRPVEYGRFGAGRGVTRHRMDRMLEQLHADRGSAVRRLREAALGATREPGGETRSARFAASRWGPGTIPVGQYGLSSGEMVARFEHARLRAWQRLSHEEGVREEDVERPRGWPEYADAFARAGGARRIVMARRAEEVRAEYERERARGERLERRATADLEAALAAGPTPDETRA